jgi:D-lyxose ketol-isomerase
VIGEAELAVIRRESAAALARAGVTLLPDEQAAIEVTDFGLGQFEQQGLVLVTYVNTDRYCAKELILSPGQTCPEHRHPPFDGGPGKQETFRCRLGAVHLYVEGIEHSTAAATPPAGSERWYSATRGVLLLAGEQYTIPPDTLHWFAADADGAIVSEFSSTSRDDLDEFTDPRVVRAPSGALATSRITPGART